MIIKIPAALNTLIINFWWEIIKVLYKNAKYSALSLKDKVNSRRIVATALV